MATRYEQDRTDVARYLPPGTIHSRISGHDVWTFSKNTELGELFTIAIYFSADEEIPGYCAQLVAPAVESAWKNVHVGHLFADGVICLGGTSMRTMRTLRDAFAKSCLWAEGMAAMIQSRRVGSPCAFPFSLNNSDGEAHFGDSSIR